MREFYASVQNSNKTTQVTHNLHEEIAQCHLHIAATISMYLRAKYGGDVNYLPKDFVGAHCRKSEREREM